LTDRLTALETTVATLENLVRRLEVRVAALEPEAHRRISTPERPVTDTDAPAGDVEEITQPTAGFSTSKMTRAVSLLGRSFLVLSGAFLLRAVTDSGALPPSVGIGVGLVYASVWIAATAVAARGGHRVSAAFHAACSVVIAYPLTWEAVRSFQVLSPEAALPIVAAVTVVGFGIAWLYDLRLVAWLFAVSAVVTTVTLIAISSNSAPASGLMVGVGILTLWLSRSRDWPVLPWLPAIAADLSVERVVAQASSSLAAARPESAITGPVAIGLAGALAIGYLASVAIQVLRRHQPITVFDMIQTAAVLAVGVGGAIRVGGSEGWIGPLTVAVGALCYVASFTVIQRRFGRGREFVYFSTLSLLLIVIGTSALLGGAMASAVWAALAVGMALAGTRYDSVTLRAHAALLATGAAIHSGLLRFEADALAVGSVGGDWLRPPMGIYLVLGSALACLVIIASSTRGRHLKWPVRLPLVLVVIVTSAGVCAEIVSLMASSWIFNIQSEAGLAALRTCVQSVGIVALAFLTVRLRVPEFGWLVYPSLVILGIKIVLQDLPDGGPLSIAIAFIFYGVALIASPRLLRSYNWSNEACEVRVET